MCRLLMSTTTNSADLGVYRVDAPLGDRLSSLYLFVGRERSVLFDSGIDGTIPTYLIPFARELGLPLSHIELVVISHCDVDHFGGIGDVHDYLPAARVVAHELDADAMENFDAFERDRGRSFRLAYGYDEGPDEWSRSVVREGWVDRRLTGDEQIDLGDRVVEIIHLPGHSRGHLAVLDPEHGTLAIGDAILGDAVPLASGAPAFPPTYRFERSYLQSIERVRDLDVASIVTAHYGSFTGPEATRFLNVSRDFALDLRARVLTAVRDARPGVGLEELARRLNPEVGSWPKHTSMAALVSPIAAHLEQLESEGLIRRDRDDSSFAVFHSGETFDKA